MTDKQPDARRPSHDALMRAQDALGDARQAEEEAGNHGAAMVLNDLVISLFQIALSDEFDDLANRAFAARYPEQALTEGSR